MADNKLGNNRTDAASIGKRIGRLIQQYDLRISYAEYKTQLYEEERLKDSSIGLDVKALRAKVAKGAWEVYATNLKTKRDEFSKSIREALVCYNDTERKIWWLYFIENKSSYEIEEATSINSRTIQRIVSGMKRDMELKFEWRLPKIESSPNWNADTLANFLEEKPSDEYVSAIRDMLAYGIIDLDALEFDEDFQKFINGERP